MTDTIIHEPHQDVIPQSQFWMDTAKAKFAIAYRKACEALQGGYAVEIDVKPLKDTRSLRANAAMWAALADVSRQVVWHGVKLSSEEWKEVLSAGLKQQRAVPGIEGGFVVLGVRTSRMSIKEMGAMIELTYAFGAQQGVKFSAPKWMEEK